MLRGERQRLGSALPLRIFLLGTILSAIAALGWQRWVRMQTQRRIAIEAADFEAGIHARMKSHLALMHGTRGLFAVMPTVTHEDFRRFFTQAALAESYRGIQGIGFSRRIPAGDLAGVVAEMRDSGRADFKVWPEEPRDEYHSIVYLVPEDRRNLAAIGYDMHTEPVRRAAMDHARDTGRAAMTAKVTLVQEIDQEKQPGFLVYLPVYGNGGEPTTVAQRRERLIGFVYAPFRAADFIRTTADRIDEDLGVTVYDDPRRSDSVLYSDEPAHGWATKRVHRAREIELANRVWTVVYSGPGGSLFVLSGIFAAGLLVGGTAAFLVRRERRAADRAEHSEAMSLERERELALLVEWVPAVVTYVDGDGILRVCNQRYRDWFGQEPSALIGRPLRDVLGAKIYAELEPAITRARRGEAASVERWHNFPGVGARYLATNYVPLRIRGGGPNGFYSLTADLTALKRAEERARFIADCGKLLISSLDTAAMARAIVHSAVPQVADVAAFFRPHDSSLVAETVAHEDGALGRELSALLASHRISMDAPHGLASAARSGLLVITQAVRTAELMRRTDEPAKRAMLEKLALRSALHVPVVVRGKLWGVFSFGTCERSGRRFNDDDRSLAEEVSTRVRLAVENSLLYSEAQQEIEERRRAQRAARETEERFRLLVAGARDYAIILIDAAGNIESWNDGAKRIFGFGEEEAAGLPIAKLSSAEDQAAGIVADELSRARNSGSALDERWYVRKDGTRFWASGHTVVLRDDEQRIRGYAKIMRDLTERKMMEEELERRVQERTTALNDAVQELEAFSYSVSHDLRSPLRSIRGFTELALEEAAPRLTESERGYLERVQRAVARLDRLISDLLAYTRVSKNKVELGPVALHTLVSDIRREHPEFQPPRAEVRIEGELLPVIGHETYLTQVLTNLLGNAVKFVRPGEFPRVRIWTEARHGTVRLHIRDNGIGIPQQHLHRAFEMFERLHMDGGYEGTGVGLAIVRRAVQRMKGSVGVESAEGEGTTFWIDLPAAGARAEAELEPAARGADGGADV